jgi:hypothetical protein
VQQPNGFIENKKLTQGEIHLNAIQRLYREDAKLTPRNTSELFASTELSFVFAFLMYSLASISLRLRGKAFVFPSVYP